MIEALSGVVVTKSDSTTFDRTRYVYVGVSGDIKVDFSHGGTAIVLKAVPVGFAPISVTRIYSAGTTATDMVALR